MQAHKIPVFKLWVPKWLAIAVILAILMTCLFSFAFYSSPVTTMGFYGIQPTDVQYAMIVLYGSTVAFLALDFRIVKYFAPRRYLIIALVVNTICSFACFHSRDWVLFVVCQFIQGITCALMSGIVLQLTFPRLQVTRARVIAYSVLYGCIQISPPFYSIYSSVILHTYNFNWLFYSNTILLIILTLVVLLTMNGQARFTKKIPLYQVDWVGYLFYIFFILSLGYIFIYGHQLGWLDSSFIRFLCFSNLLILILFISRESKLKRPLINLRIFKEKNFIIGLLLLFTFYIFKSSTGLAYGYLDIILGHDPLSTIPIWTAVIAGTVLSMFVTSRFILKGYNLIKIIIAGFGCMALYYTCMILFVSKQGETGDFILPMFIYGIATGILFVPIVSFTTSASPPKISINASLLGIFARFTGFTVSMAFNNEFQLYTTSAVREKFRETLTETTPQWRIALQDIKNQHINAGSDIYTAKEISGTFFNHLIGEQLLIRATRDYYFLMLVGVIFVIAILLLSPHIRNVVLRIRKTNIPY